MTPTGSKRLASPATRELLRPHLPLDFSGFPGLPPIRAAAQADALVQVPDSGFVTRLDRCGNLRRMLQLVREQRHAFHGRDEHAD